MTGWHATTTTKLVEQGAIEIGDGYRAKNAEFVKDGGLPFVRVGDVGATLVLDGLDELPLNLIGEYGSKVSRPFDSMITMKGTVGRVAYVAETYRPFVYSPQVSYWRSLDSTRVHPRWLRYWLESPEFLTQALATKGATDMADYINLRDQRRMRITLPPLPLQHQIAEALGGFDDLLMNNRQRIELLEKMAQTVYKEWFVWFRYPGHENDALVDSPLGPIPEAWSVSTIAEAAVTLTRGIAPKYSDLGPWTVLNQKCIRDHRVNLDQARLQERQVPSAKQVRFGDVLINSTGVGTLGRVAAFLEVHSSLTVDSHVTIVRPAAANANPWFAMNLMGREAEFEALGTGSTGQTELSRLDIGGLPLLIPPPDLRETFGDSTWPILRLIPQLLNENRALGSIRNLLLPKLLTGQIDVSTFDLDALEESMA